MKLFRGLLFVSLVAWCAPTWAGMVWSGVAVDQTLVQRLKVDTRALGELIDNPPKESSVYLDKAWHGIHFLLTGSAAPASSLASKVIFGGTSVGPDQGYGPAKLLSPSEVRQIAELLTLETPEKLAQRYNPQTMERAEIYPSIIWVREGQEALQYELVFYVELVRFYQRAAREGKAVVLVIH